MKKLLWSIIATIVILIGIMVAVPYFVDANKYKPFIIDSAKRATGRDLAIEGDISLSLFPDISLEVSKVTLGNIPEAKDTPMVSVSELQVQIALLPLLQGGKINVKRFVLVDPEIHLLVTREGGKNWQFTTPSIDAPEQKIESPSIKGGTVPATITMIHDVSIKNGTLYYTDKQKKSSLTLTKVNTSLMLTGTDDPLILSGSAEWNGITTSAEAKVDNIKELFGAKGSKTTLQVSSELLFASYHGTLSLAETNSGSGTFEVRSSDVGGLTSWINNKPAETPNKHALALKGSAEINGKRMRVSGLDLTLDKIKATGDLAANFSTDIPSVQGTLTAGDINLEPYFAETSKNEESTSGMHQQTSEDWSTDPIKLDALRSVNADISLTAKSFSTPKIHLEAIDAKINLKNGKLNTTLNEVGFYEGALKGSIVVDASGATPSVQKQISLTSVNAEKFFRDTFDFKKVSGKLNATMNVTTSGKNQKAMVSNLNGTGNFNLEEGKIRGIDLISMVRNVATSFTSTGENQATEFSAINGSFVISNGIVKNNDLVIKAPLLNVQGAGTADLPHKYLDYRLVPQVIGTFKGSTQATGLQGVAVPVIVKGPFSKLKFAPDVGNVIKEVLEDPTKAKERLKSLEDNIKSIGKGLKLELR